MARERDKLSILKETYKRQYLKEADLNTETKSANDLITTIKNELINHPESQKYSQEVSEIEKLKDLAQNEVEMRNVVSKLRGLVKPIRDSRINFSKTPIEKRKYDTHEKTTMSDYEKIVDKRMKVTPKGLEALAKKLSIKDDGEKLDVPPIEEPVVQQPQVKKVDLNSLQSFLDNNKADLSENGYKLASNAIQKAKTTNSDEDISIAKDLVDQAANGDI